MKMIIFGELLPSDFFTTLTNDAMDTWMKLDDKTAVRLFNAQINNNFYVNAPVTKITNPYRQAVAKSGSF